MRRLAKTLSALGFLWACAATVFLVAGAGTDGISLSSALTAGEPGVGHLAVPLLSANGVWVVGLLLLVTLVAGLPLGLALTYPESHRSATLTAGLLVLGFSIISGFAVGLMYLPVGFMLLAAAAGELSRLAVEE